MGTPATEGTVTFRLSDDGEHVEWDHDCPVHAPMRAEATLPLGAHGWTVQQREPLTVTPSILCRGCGLHGYITAGEWRSV